jgi:hypothetical protein
MHTPKITTAAISLGLLSGVAATAGSASAATTRPAAASSVKPWTVYYEDSGRS